MNREEMNELAAIIATTTTDMVVKKLRGMRELADTDYVDSTEAARILGVSPNYIRQVKDKYPHIKAGNSKQGRIMFKRDALLHAFK